MQHKKIKHDTAVRRHAVKATTYAKCFECTVTMIGIMPAPAHRIARHFCALCEIFCGGPKGKDKKP